MLVLMPLHSALYCKSQADFLERLDTSLGLTFSARWLPTCITIKQTRVHRRVTRCMKVTKQSPGIPFWHSKLTGVDHGASALRGLRMSPRPKAGLSPFSLQYSQWPPPALWVSLLRPPSRCLVNRKRRA